MPLYHVLGETLVDQDEMRERMDQNDAEIAAFGSAVERSLTTNTRDRKTDEISIRFSSGVATMPAFLENHTLDGQTPFQPVGIGKPATILLRHVYTGRFGNNDMLLTSAIRDPFTTFNLATRGINLMPKRVPKKKDISGPAATENGTELVYYINALTAQALTLTFDMAFDDFPDELVNEVGGAISAAGAIPVFGPYSGILIGVGMAVKLISKLANALVDARPEFSATAKLEFDVPGAPIPMSGYKVLAPETLDQDALRFELGRGLVRKDTGKKYDGDDPYIVFLLDGTRNESFQNFTPTAASAALLSKFLSQKEGAHVAIDTITDAIKLFSDMRYRREADRLKEQIDKLPAGSEERTKLEERRTAAIANILEELLKPAS